MLFFKYANFFIAEINTALVHFQYFPVNWKAVVFPIGISFFTFKKLSYVIDV